MGLVLQGNSGKVYVIGDDKIAGGGEGGIYLIENDESQVVKIFKPEKRTTQREEKIRLMVKEKLNDNQLKQITWPQDTVYDQSGFVGYVMPRLKSTTSLTEIYNAKKYDLRYRLMVAVNLCAAIDTVHEMGQVCGDLNPQNICINANTSDKENAFHVTLVDTDSYHFTANNKTYRCEVGLGDYIAPELQKKLADGSDLKIIPLPTYTRETDLFALAVHIFYLLMNGCHPFACAKTNDPKETNIKQFKAGNIEESVVAPQPVENIIKGFFPFAEKKQGITIPVYAPDFESLPLNIQELFIKTFKKGFDNPRERVSASEWKEALLSATRNIIKCSENEMHYYFNNVNHCPLCQIDENINDVLGINLSSKASLSDTNDDEINTYGIQKVHDKWKNRIALACIALIFIFVIIGAYNYDNNSADDDYYLTEEITQSAEEEYEDMIDIADIYLSDDMFDEAISKCDEAIEFSPEYCDAYYIKAKALYEKKDLEKALAVLKDEEENGYGRGFKYVNGELDELKDKIKEEIEKKAEQESITKENKKRLKKLNRIIANIKGKKYKKAEKLIDRYCEKNYFGKIYVKDGKIVDSIKKGTGFLISERGWYAYYGKIKNGKAEGKGTEVGVFTDSYYWLKGKFKKGYANGKCTYYDEGEDWSEKIIGNFTNGYENGNMVSEYHSSNGHTDKYYYYANMGKYQVKEYRDGEYIYGYSKTGDWYLRKLEKSNLYDNGAPRRK